MTDRVVNDRARDELLILGGACWFSGARGVENLTIDEVRSAVSQIADVLIAAVDREVAR